MQKQTSKRAAYNWQGLMWTFWAICVGWWLASGCASPKQVRLDEDTPSRDAPSSEQARRSGTSYRQPGAERTDSYGRASGHSPSISKIKK